MTDQTYKRASAIRVVLPFVFRYWLDQPARAAAVAGGLLGATVADLLMPVFSGHLVDAVTTGASDVDGAPRRTMGVRCDRGARLCSG